jgi:hypothetical protein
MVNTGLTGVCALPYDSLWVLAMADPLPLFPRNLFPPPSPGGNDSLKFANPWQTAVDLLSRQETEYGLVVLSNG